MVTGVWGLVSDKRSIYSLISNECKVIQFCEVFFSCNIQLTADLVPKLCDFGLSRVKAHASRQTSASGSIGCTEVVCSWYREIIVVPLTPFQ